MLNKLNVFTDGGARGNPGPSAIGVSIENQDKEKIVEFGKKIGTVTNNVAEYKAVLEALSWISENKKQLEKDTKICFFLDSNLVCNQINGLFKVKDSRLRELLFSVREKEKETGYTISYQYIPREQNKNADKLVNLALDQALGD